jgi:hypothetical protein
MPRYRLAAGEAAHLAAYLETLARQPAPGVDADVLHLATVIGENAGVPRRQALLSVLEAYVRRHNLDVRHARARAGSSPWYRDELARGDREWRLHVWDLAGPADGWNSQLDAHLATQPVFAVVSGVAAGPWRPVHDFCERRELPCLFPATDLPVVAPEGDSTLYLTPGLELEAAAVARWLAGELRGGDTVVVVHRPEPEGRVPAAALRRELVRTGRARVELLEKGRRGDGAAYWNEVVRRLRPDALVLWAGADEVADLAAAAASAEVPRVVLSATFLDEPLRLPAGPLGTRALVASCFALPGREAASRHRARAWLRARGVAPTEERLQLNAYFALAVTEHALERLAGEFSRALFVESVEAEVTDALNPGIFPTLGLAPGQRFAARRCAVAKPGEPRWQVVAALPP